MSELTATMTLPCGATIEGVVLAYANYDALIYAFDRITTASRLHVEFKLSGTSIHETECFVHWSDQEDFSCRIGVYLARPIPECELPWPLNDIRRDIRFPVEIPASLSFDHDKAVLNGVIKEYSSNGIQVEVDEPAVDGPCSKQGGNVLVSTRHKCGDNVYLKGVLRWTSQRRGKCVVGVELSNQQGRALGGTVLYQRR